MTKYSQSTIFTWSVGGIVKRSYVHCTVDSRKKDDSRKHCSFSNAFDTQCDCHIGIHSHPTYTSYGMYGFRIEYKQYTHNQRKLFGLEWRLWLLPVFGCCCCYVLLSSAVISMEIEWINVCARQNCLSIHFIVHHRRPSITMCELCIKQWTFVLYAFVTQNVR